MAFHFYSLFECLVSVGRSKNWPAGLGTRDWVSQRENETSVVCWLLRNSEIYIWIWSSNHLIRESTTLSISTLIWNLWRSEWTSVFETRHSVSQSEHSSAFGTRHLVSQNENLLRWYLRTTLRHSVIYIWIWSSSPLIRAVQTPIGHSIIELWICSSMRWIRESTTLSSSTLIRGALCHLWRYEWTSVFETRHSVSQTTIDFGGIFRLLSDIR